MQATYVFLGRLTFKLLNLKTKLLSGTGQIQQSVVRVQQDGHKHKNTTQKTKMSNTDPIKNWG